MRKLIFSVIFLLIVASAANALPIAWWGDITIDDLAAPAGTEIALFIDGVKFDNTTSPSLPSLADNQYSITGLATDGQLVTIQIWDILAESYTWNSADEGSVFNLNISVNRSADGTACSYAQSCLSGICCNNVCASSCVTPSGGGGGGGGGGRTTGASACIPAWSCGSWGACFEGEQVRICIDNNACGILTNKPATSQSCEESTTGTLGTTSTATGNTETTTGTQGTQAGDTNVLGQPTPTPAENPAVGQATGIFADFDAKEFFSSPWTIFLIVAIVGLLMFLIVAKRKREQQPTA